MAPSGDKKLTWLITGCSSGIGLSLARHVLSRGHNVIATSRNPSKVPDLVAEVEASSRGKFIALDPNASLDAIKVALDPVWKAFPGGGIDVLVNNAAYSVLGAVEDISDEAAKAMFETNFFGVLRVIKAVLPSMRERRSGTIVNISSLVGMTVFPAVGIYGASKYAIEGMLHKRVEYLTDDTIGVSQALYQELKPLGIRVLLVELGAFRTNFLGSTMQAVMPSAPYRAPNAAGVGLQTQFDSNGKQPNDPEKAAPKMFEVITGTGDGEGKTHYLRLPLGSDSWDGIVGQMEADRKNFDVFEEVARTVGFDG